MTLRLLSVFTVLALVFASDVLELTGENWEATVSDKPLILVEFYAPWCGHCKKLAPDYEIIATQLKEDGISVGKIDADNEGNRDVATRFEIKGFPTLKIFRNGEEALEYQGDRSVNAIVSFMRRQNRPAVTEMATAAEVEAFTKAEKVVIVGFFAESAAPEYEAFKATAEKMRADFSFAAVLGNPEIATQHGVSAPAVVLFKQFDEGKNILESDKLSTLEQFIKISSVPLIDEIGPENYRKYVESGLPMAYLFVDLSVEGQKDEYVNRLTEVAKSAKGKVNFIFIDWGKFSRHSERVGLGKVVPSFTIDDLSSGKHYAFDETKEVTGASISQFVDDFLAGKLVATIRSEEIPADNNGPVTVVVAKNFDQIVLDNTKDVLLEFYAPWCGHCKHLVPIYEEVGQAFESNENIVIAKIDATANDVDAKYGVQGFPTIKFFPAGAKDTPLDYNGERTTEAFVDFINQNAQSAKPKDEL